MKLFFFSCVLVLGVYFLSWLLIRRRPKIHIKPALRYISTVMLLGVFAEVFIDSVYNMTFGTPLWTYQVLPIHNAYTSYYSLFVWGLYGFHLYVLHVSFGRKIRSVWVLGVIVALEALVLEILLNVFFLTFFGHYIFYYLPGDLWHATSIQAFPLYFIAGFLIARLIKDERVDSWFYTIVNVYLTSVLVFFTS